MGLHRSAAGTARAVCAGVKRAAAHWRRCASAGAARAVFAGAARARRSAGRHGERLAEVVSPVCRYEDIEMVQAAVRAIRAAGAKADRSCGIHIHVGLGQHTPASLRRLVNLVNAKEDLLTQALGISPGRRARWCRPVNPEFLNELNRRKPDTMEALAQLERERGNPQYQEQEEETNAPAAQTLEKEQRSEEEQQKMNAYNAYGTTKARRKGWKTAKQVRAASNEMCTFLILNISSLQLIPVNMIAYRSKYGSANPASIIAPSLAATLFSSVIAILYCKSKDR